MPGHPSRIRFPVRASGGYHGGIFPGDDGRQTPGGLIMAEGVAFRTMDQGPRQEIILPTRQIAMERVWPQDGPSHKPPFPLRLGHTIHHKDSA